MWREIESGTRTPRHGRESGWRGAHFTDRAEPETLPEWMDEPCSSEVLAGCLRDLERMNRLTMSYRPTLRFLRGVAERHRGRELHIVDVGSGYGDTLRAISRWAERRKVRVRLTGIDLNPQTEAIAREATRAAGMRGDAIEWRTGDAMAEADLQAPDVVVSSLVTHHLRHEEIVRFLRWMDGSARVGWFINDLERKEVPARLFSALAVLMRWHPFLHHDGPVSFRRAFRVADWKELLREADVVGEPGEPVYIVPTFPGRLCVERRR